MSPTPSSLLYERPSARTGPAVAGLAPRPGSRRPVRLAADSRRRGSEAHVGRSEPWPAQRLGSGRHRRSAAAAAACSLWRGGTLCSMRPTAWRWQRARGARCRRRAGPRRLRPQRWCLPPARFCGRCRWRPSHRGREVADGSHATHGYRPVSSACVAAVQRSA